MDYAENERDASEALSAREFDSEIAAMASSDDDESVDSRIYFIAEKQSILKRAATMLMDEECYDASNALNAHSIKSLPSETSGTIWHEARGILRALSTRGSDIEPTGQSARLRTTSNRPRKSPCRELEIDTSVVHKIPSNDYMISHGSNVPSSEFSVLKAEGAPSQWMAQALISSSIPRGDEVISSASCWKIMAEPTQRYSTGLQPPSNAVLTDSVEMQEALSVTPSARLVTASVPPFKIVHANKAFLLDIGCTSSEVIGRPVEEVLHVNLNSLDGNSSRRPFDCLLSPHLSDFGTCSIRLCPVSERNSAFVSHVLIKVARDTSSSLENEPRSATRQQGTGPTVASYSHELVGAVG